MSLLGHQGIADLKLRRDGRWSLKAFRTLKKLLQRALITSISGAERVEQSDSLGTQMKFPEQRTKRFPFDVKSYFDSDASEWRFNIAPGTFHGLFPTIDGDHLYDEPPPYLVFDPAGTVQVYLKIESTLTVVDDFVTSWTFDAVTIDSAASVPDDDKTAGTFYRSIATFVDGKRTAQNITSSLDGELEDTYTGEGKAELFTWQT